MRRAESIRSGRFSSRDSCSSRRAASSTWSASCRCWPPPPPRLLPLCRALAQPLGFLLLAARELLQLLGELVDLLVALLLLCALRGLVLVGHLVHLELEQVGQILGHLALPAAATAAALLALHADLGLVLLLRLLEDLQRLLLEGDRAVRARLLQLGLRPIFISVTACGRSSATFLNAGSCCTSRLFIRVTRPSTWSRSFACDSAITVEFSRSLSAAIVLRSRLMLKVAAMICRCCCDSAPTCWPPPPPPPPPPPAFDSAFLNSLRSGRICRK